MKPTLTAFAASAALACLALPAQAQAQSQSPSTSSVVLSGLVDAYAGSMRNAGDAGRTAVLGSGGLTTSWFGFKGIEDLGGGLKATFAVTSFFRPDTGSQGRFNSDPIFSRDANVGLAGGFGTVQLGRGLAPNFLPTILANPFGDSFTFSPLVLHANVSTAGWPRTTTPADTGWSNQVIYSTPKFGGFGANLHYQFGEQSSTTGNDNRKNVGLNGTYFGGPVTLVAFYERDQISNPVNPGLLTTTIGGAALPETRKNWMVGGAYDFTIVKAFGTYGRSKAEISSLESKTGSLGVSVPVGAGSILAAVARTEATSNAFNADRTTASIGYDYFLSKRTDVYAIAMRDRVTSLPSGTSVGVGVRHRF